MARKTDSAGGSVAPPYEVRLRLPRGRLSARWWSDAIHRTVVTARDTLIHGDDRQMNRVLKFSRVLGELSRSHVPHSGAAEIEAELTELVGYVEDISAGKSVDAKPLALASPGETLRSGQGPVEAVSRSGDPVPDP